MDEPMEQFNVERGYALRNLIGLITEAEMVLLLEVTTHTLQMWRSTGTGPRYVKLGRTVMYRVADVIAWVDANVQTGTPAAKNQE